MSKKLKIYCVSVLAFMAVDDALSLSFLTGAESDVSTYVESLPALIPAYSIDEAGEQAEKFALDRWKTSDGWYGHQAAITPVTKNFYEATFKAYEAGVVDDGPDEIEQGKTFAF